MNVTLSADVREQVERELASGFYSSPDELIEKAIRHFLDEQSRAKRRTEALRSIGRTVDESGLYDQVLIPDEG